MPGLISPPPVTAIEPVTELLHGVPVTDPYRWLEDQNSPRTRAWIEAQTQYARAYLDNIPGRERIRERVREFLAVETYDSLRKVGNRYFFRKRLPDQEQPCICMREGMQGADQVLVDPSHRGTGSRTAVRLQRVSPGGELLLYEVKQGGERSGMFEILDVATRTPLPDVLPRGYLRGSVFAADGKSFYYVHESLDSARPHYRAVHLHVLGRPFHEDEEIFCAGESERVRLHLAGDSTCLAFLACKFHEKALTTLSGQIGWTAIAHSSALQRMRNSVSVRSSPGENCLRSLTGMRPIFESLNCVFIRARTSNGWSSSRKAMPVSTSASSRATASWFLTFAGGQLTCRSST